MYDDEKMEIQQQDSSKKSIVRIKDTTTKNTDMDTGTICIIETTIRIATISTTIKEPKQD